MNEFHKTAKMQKRTTESCVKGHATNIIIIIIGNCGLNSNPKEFHHFEFSENRTSWAISGSCPQSTNS